MTENPAPDLSIPPDPFEFERVVRLGLGRAVLFLQRHDAAPYRRVILEAALDDWTWPGDTVGTRERYVLDLIDASDRFDFYRERVLAAFPAVIADVPGDGSRRADQFVRLLSLLARRGDQEARTTLRDAFEADPYRFPDASVFIEQDGMAGLIFVARRLGAAFLAGGIDKDSEQFARVWFSAEEALGEDSVWSTLREAADGDRQIEAIADAGLRRQQRWHQSTRRHPRDEVREVGFVDLERTLNEPTRGRRNSLGWRRSWGRYASDDDLMRAARRFTALAQDKPRLLERYIDLFKDRAFPLDPSYLIHIVRRGNLRALPPQTYIEEWDRDDRLAWKAALALENVVHPAVRALGLELLKRSRWTARGANMLARNATESDLVHLVDAFRSEMEEWPRHDIGIAIRKLSDRRALSGITEALGIVYELGLCSCCRGSVVRRLNDLRALPAWMAAECRFDSDEDTRKLAES